MVIPKVVKAEVERNLEITIDAMGQKLKSLKKATNTSESIYWFDYTEDNNAFEQKFKEVEEIVNEYHELFNKDKENALDNAKQS